MSSFVELAGEYNKAKESGTKGVTLCRSSNDKANETTGWNTIGLSHLYLGDYDLTVTHFEKALELDRSTGANQVKR